MDSCALIRPIIAQPADSLPKVVAVPPAALANGEWYTCYRHKDRHFGSERHHDQQCKQYS